jgi:hypothetical protein
MSLNIRPEIEAGLRAIAQARGVTVEAYLQDLVARELPTSPGNMAGAADAAEPASGMVRENGIQVYRTGRPLPASVVDEAIKRSREDRIKI